MDGGQLMGVPQARFEWGSLFHGNPTKIRMRTRGSPFLGQLHMVSIDFLGTRLLIQYPILAAHSYCVPIFDAKADLRPAKKTMAMWSVFLIKGPD